MGTIVDKFNYSFEAKDLIKDSINNLGGSITSETELKEYAQELDNIYDNLPKTTGEDTNLSLTTLKGKMNIIPKGDTQQTQYSGINLCEAKLPTMTNSGITITNNGNGTFTINGTNTSTGTTTFRLDQSTQSGIDNLQNYEDGTYTLDLGIVNENIGINLMQNSTWTTFISTGFNTRLKSGTITNVTNTFIYIGIKGSATINNVTIKPMFVKGSYTTSTMPSFEPYVGGTASPNPTYPQDIEVVTGTQEVKVENVNLLKFTQGKTATSSGLTATCNDNSTITINGTSSGMVAMAFNIDTKPLNGNYTLSGYTRNDTYLQLYTKNSSGTIRVINMKGTPTLSFSNETLFQIFIFVANGTTATFNNETFNLQLEKGSVATPYKPHQEQTQVVELSSKNLVDFSNLITGGTSTTYTFTNDTSTISNTSGTYNSVSIELVDMVKANAGKTLKFVCEQADFSNTKTNSEESNVVQLKVVNNGTTSYNGLLKKNLTSATYTIPSDTTNITSAVLQMSSNNTATSQSASTTIIKPMLIFNGESETYEEFYNYELCKIGNYQDYLYKTSGKQMLDLTNGTYSQNGITAVVSNGGITLNGTATTNAFIDIPTTHNYTLENNETYTIATNNPIASQSGAVRFRVQNSGTLDVYCSIANAIKTFVYNTGDGFTNKVMIRVASGVTLTNYFLKPMLVKGSTIGNYEPYGSDKWYKKEQIPKIILNGNETGWYYDSTNQRYYNQSIIASNCLKPENNNTKAEAVSNIGVITANQTIYNSGYVGLAIHPNGSIYLTKEAYTNISTTNVVLYYVYATYEDIQITNETLIEQLDNLEKLKSYNGTTNISSSGNLSAILGVSAIKGES